MLHSLTMKMIDFDKGDPFRIQHFLKVHEFSKLIGEGEDLDAHTLFVLEAASIVHDIGIHVALDKFGYQNGKLQEQEGPSAARKMCEELGFEEKDIERICYLIAHHHTYTNVEGIDYRILLEADFLVNAFEEDASMENIKNAKEHIFETKTGKHIIETMFKV